MDATGKFVYEYRENGPVTTACDRCSNPPVNGGTVSARQRFRTTVLPALLVSVLAVSACAGETGDSSSDSEKPIARIVTVGTPGTNVGFLFDDIPAAVEAAGGGAEDAGYFPSTQPALEALSGGAADLATIVTSGALTGLTGTGDYLFLGVAKASAGQSSSIVVPANSDIKTVEDLAGKSVAVTKGAAGEYIVDQAMLNHGMPADSIKKVYLGPGDAAGAFIQGSIDAWAAFDIFIPAAVTKMGARVLVTGDDELTGKFDYPVLVVTRSFAEAHPEVTAAVLKGYAEGGQHVIEDPDEYLSIQKTANDFSPEQMDYIFDRLLVYEAYDAQTLAELQESIDSWNEIGTLSEKLVAKDIVFDVASVPAS